MITTRRLSSRNPCDFAEHSSAASGTPGAYRTTNHGRRRRVAVAVPCNGDCPSADDEPGLLDLRKIGSSPMSACGLHRERDDPALEERGSGVPVRDRSRGRQRGSLSLRFPRASGGTSDSTSIPKPIVTSSQYIDSIHRVGFRFRRSGPGFYGLRGSGDWHDHRDRASLSAPRDVRSAGRSAWTLRARSLRQGRDRQGPPISATSVGGGTTLPRWPPLWSSTAPERDGLRLCAH